MKKILLIVTLISIFTISSYAKSFDKKAYREKIEYTSYNVETYNDVLTGNYKSSKKAKLSGELYLPSNDGKYPVVILQHGSGSMKFYNNWFGEIVPELVKKGIGVFINDSISGRGLGSTSKDQTKLSGTSRVLDAFFALEKLSKHNNVIPEKIGITGYSFGGFVSHMTANNNLIKALNLKITFAAHLPVYPTCQAYFKQIDLINKPILFLLAEKDNWTPAKYCIEYVEKIKKNGSNNVKYKIYSGAYHGFIYSGIKECKKCFKVTKCNAGYINDQGFYVWAGQEHKGKWKEMIQYLGKKCGGRGVKTGGSKKDKENLIQDTVNFFKNSL